MFQRILPLAVPTYVRPRVWRDGSLIGVSCFALMCAVLLVPLGSVHGQTTVNYNFEDGIVRGNPTYMKVPPKIITENGNKFMRITGSTGDCESVPSSLCPPRNRSIVMFLSPQGSMPLITSANMSQTYSARIRYTKVGGSSGVTFELFQSGKRTGGYGTADDYGPVIFMWRGANGHVTARAYYASGTKSTDTDLGYIAVGSWHAYTVKAVWSHDPSKGRLEFYLDGKLKKTISGRDVNGGPTSNRLPTMKLGLYGDNAVGIIDVDNVKAGPSSGSSAPTNVRVVSGQ
jgi:Polysaccharide lyase